jgi:hypothetical protein
VTPTTDTRFFRTLSNSESMTVLFGRWGYKQNKR